MIDRFEEGKKYRYRSKVRGQYWSSIGEMDFVLDGKPRVCIDGASSDCADLGDNHYWVWGDLSMWEEVIDTKQLKRGDYVRTPLGEIEIFLVYVEGLICPYLCVPSRQEQDYKAGKIVSFTAYSEVTPVSNVYSTLQKAVDIATAELKKAEDALAKFKEGIV